jgi:UDP-N-acetylmuramate dehydrogenase
MPKGLPTPLRERLRRDEPLSRHTTFRIGGAADLFLAVQTEGELIATVRWARERGLPYVVLGGGSNVLVADEGVRGLVIANRAANRTANRTSGRQPKRAVSYQPSATGHRPCQVLHLASCVPLGRFARYAIHRRLAGLEWAVGIPGTVGGAIVGNAGAHGGCVADSLVAVRVLDAGGEVRALAAAEMGFGYRSSLFKRRITKDEERGEDIQDRRQAIILSAEFALQAGDRQELEARATEYLAQRRRMQPKGFSAGSVFRNPSGDTAGRLIEAAGLKETRCGGARISEKHANFIINCAGATAADVLALMDLARQRVFGHCGVALEPEIVFVGDWARHPPFDPLVSDHQRQDYRTKRA